MYSIEGLSTIQEIKQYVLKVMKKLKIGPLEMREFNIQVDKYDFNYAVQVATEYLEEFNRMEEQKQKVLVGEI